MKQMWVSHNIKKILILSICIFVFLSGSFSLSVSSSNNLLGNSYYVDAIKGNDARSTVEAQDPATPWKTIQKAAETAAAGDTVIIQPGVYREAIFPANDDVTFEANDGDRQQGEQSVRMWGSEDSRAMSWHDLNAADCDASLFPQMNASDRSKVYCTDLSGADWQQNDAWIVPDLVAEVAETDGTLTRLTKAREPDALAETDPKFTVWKHHEYWWRADGGSRAGDTSMTKLFDATDDTLPAGVESGHLGMLGDLTGGTVFLTDNFNGFYQYRREISGSFPKGIELNTDRSSGGSPVGIGGGEGEGSRDHIGEFTKYFVEGKPQLLDTPGEWVYDKASKKLYIWSGASPAVKHLEIAKRSYGFSLSNPEASVEELCRNQVRSGITLKGISIELINADYWNRPDQPFNWLRPGSGAIKAFFGPCGAGGASDLTMVDLKISHASTGIRLQVTSDNEARTQNINLSDSEIGYIDGRAIEIIGNANSVDRGFFPVIQNVILKNNHIHHAGFRPENKMGEGVRFGLGLQGLTLENNLFEDFAHMGVAIVNAPPAGHSAELLIKDNIMRRACQNGPDCGNLYFWTPRGRRGEAAPVSSFDKATIVGNTLADAYGWSYAINSCQAPYNQPGNRPCEFWRPRGEGDSEWGLGHGLYLDNASGPVVYRNIIRNNSETGIFYGGSPPRAGRMAVYNNVIQDSPIGLHIGQGQTEKVEPFGDLTIVNNVFFNTTRAAISLAEPTGNVTIDYNLYKLAGGVAMQSIDGENYATRRATAADTDFEAQGVDYEAPIFVTEPPVSRTDYVASEGGDLVDGGSPTLPDFFQVTQATDYPRQGNAYDIGINEGSSPVLATDNPEQGDTIDAGGIEGSPPEIPPDSSKSNRINNVVILIFLTCLAIAVFALLLVVGGLLWLRSNESSRP